MNTNMQKQALLKHPACFGQKIFSPDCVVNIWSDWCVECRIVYKERLWVREGKTVEDALYNMLEAITEYEQ
jgi:hypothetical protein